MWFVHGSVPSDIRRLCNELRQVARFSRWLQASQLSVSEQPKVTPWGVMPGTSSCGTLAVCGRFRSGGKMARSGQGGGESPQAIVAEGSSRPGAAAGGLGC